MRVTNKLTALGVTRTKKTGRYADGGNLYLQVGDSGTKAWLFRFMLGGKSREMGLGPVDLVSLSEAREAARDSRKLLLQNIDPIEHRRQQQMLAALAKKRAVPFETCARDYIKDQRAGWKNEKHADQWTSTLENWVFPIIGKLPVDGISTDLVLQVLKQPIGEKPDAPTFWTARTETASRVRGRIETVLDWARAKKLRDGENPARWKGSLDKLLPSKSQVAPVQHHKALPYADLPHFMAELRSRNSLSARALEFTILTAARTNDTIGATGAEINDKDAIWTVPASRLKGRKGARQRNHVVPLSDRAIHILDNLPKGSAYLFAADDDQPLSNMAMLELLQGMGFDENLTVHGFRSTFKDWCSEQTAFPNEMSELALAHTVSDKVEAAYRRGDMREKRRRMMADWADYCASPPVGAKDNVVSIRSS